MIKVIFFDAAGTLFHLQRTPGENYADVAREQGVDLSPIILDRSFLRAWKQAPVRAAIAGARLDDDKGWWRQLVDVVLADYPGLPATFNPDLFFESAYHHFAEPGVWTLYSDVEETLVRLSPHFQLGIISNFDQRLHSILQHTGIAQFFSRVFLSSQLGADKPDPEIYCRALAISGFSARDAIHVGDDPERDWKAAGQAGVRVFKLDRQRNSLRDLLDYLAQAASSCFDRRSSLGS